MLLVAPSGEEQRELGVRFFSGWSMFDSEEPRAPVGVVEPLREQSRRAGMLLRRARPEHAVVRFDLCVSDSGVIGSRAGGRTPQFVEDTLRRAERELLAAAKSHREFAKHVEVASRAAGWA